MASSDESSLDGLQNRENLDGFHIATAQFARTIYS
ncbi:hypothetical protein SM0020_11765 [Sinorhizobium meliloti CCNWSX0020]|uniref:Uncharacterized protein n=1 Tax=Sinorhizobium meliloti CCNWSX0020 TaxID=1107881 RepID=H0FYP9_RHIML|nr:hypothetical protein SM0020_11765 [Sinorhizobium meliloti CCNWSX0020]PII38199.1 hypothetical protein T190_25620 [Sinorhizobium meliloti CCBAU 01290]